MAIVANGMLENFLADVESAGPNEFAGIRYSASVAMMNCRLKPSDVDKITTAINARKSEMVNPSKPNLFQDSKSTQKGLFS